MRKKAIYMISGLWMALSPSAMVCQGSAECPAGNCGTCVDKVCEASPAPVAAEKPAAVKEAATEAEISTRVLERLIRSAAKVVVLDARSGKYDDGMRIPGARSLSATATEDEVKALVASNTDLVVTYCSNLKCPASRMLAGRLRELGYVNVLEYPEGIAGWKEAGNEVVKAK